MSRALVTSRKLAACAVVLCTTGVLAAGCLDRPVVSQNPTLKTNFTSQVKQQAVDKLDILFMIDNSASMGDKQLLLEQAVPDLIKRLINPNCVDTMGNTVGPSTNGMCGMGSQLEFPPVHDMHIGVLSSSLGGRGSDSCPTMGMNSTNPANPSLSAHNDDQGHLLNRQDPMNQQVENPVADEGMGNFLAWLPSSNPANNGKPPPPNGVVPVQDVNTFSTDFTDLISGVHQFGCGFEAQTEAWYRFLVQPDPFQSVAVNGGRAQLMGIDQVVLQQRHDFLRPDSLLAVIAVTDETEEVVDPMALGGQGWAYMNSTFPGAGQGQGAPKGTAICAMNPNDNGCNSCAFVPNDSNCTPSPFYNSSDDNLNVRTFNMKQRFGVDVRPPVSRAIRGLTQPIVPNQGGEHFGGDANYTGDAHADWDGQDMNADEATHGCMNPIYALSLPTDPNGELCHLQRGPRTKDLVYYGIIGGVPHQLLQVNPADPNSPQKDTFTDGMPGSDWWKILGKDPLNYDFTGVDPHMLQSDTPRQGIAAGDAINGGDFDNGKTDLEYACIFQLTTTKNCADPKIAAACDCEGNYNGPLCQNPPPYGPNNSVQIKGKAYPSIRELSIARALGDQGIVSSLCPIHVTDNAAMDDPLFGYRPAVTTIVNRLKNALANQCLPNPLTPNPDGSVDCLILETLGGTATDCRSTPTGADGPQCQAACTGATGLFYPSDAQYPGVLKTFRQQQVAGATPGDNPLQHPVCAVTEILPKDFASGSCATVNNPGWCYVTGAAAGACPQAILFSPSGNPQAGATISLQCIETATGATDAGTTGGGG
jgi:hypothetical protein